ncbi:MAG: NADH:flavin oxidoreductase [Proteobacteria bacterium]|nr:NADH:flavin oxidoreductase [Pseudomonadota bacterium]
MNGMTIKNRFVRSATWAGMAGDDGSCTPKLIELMVKLAGGGVGLIISGHTYVCKKGQASPWQLGIYKDELVPGLQEMTDAVHEKGGKIMVQLAHAGMFANSKLAKETPVAPSALSGFTEHLPKEMDLNDIEELVEAFGQAALRGKSAGFDGVQIHAAHGYLLSQFLSPVFNKRNDRYGGSLENRANFLLEILKSIRAKVGDDYPLLIKMNSRDFLEGGLELEESIKVGAMLKEEGIDAIEISGGTAVSGKLSPVRTGILSEDDEAYFKDAARAFKESIDIPLILVGGIRSLGVAKYIVDNNIADYISMSRPFIREPDLINRWKSGSQDKANCLSDSKCFAPAMSGKGVYCVVEKRLRDKKT